jgi:diacylglycerol kinase family enzyme
MLDAVDALHPAPRLGLLPLGSGGDLARSLALPRRLSEALDVIAADHVHTIDAGRLEHRDLSGRPSRRHFVNEASVGLSGVTVARVGRLAKRVGPGVAFAVGAISAILSHRPIEVAIEIDGVRHYEGPVSLVVAANGRTFGAGMQVAPGARLDDGLLEVVLVRGLTVPRLLSNLPSLYRGRHGAHPAVSFHAGRTLEVLSKEVGAPIELDGESVGELPMRAEILPGALRVFVDPERARCGAGEGRARMREA